MTDLNNTQTKIAKEFDTFKAKAAGLQLYFDTLIPDSQGKIYDAIGGMVGIADKEDSKPPYHFLVPNATEFMKGSVESQSISVTLW
ncbi:MAG: hypothetical protein QF704_17680 [Anaerolineales bacterium]|nr:hypothetical protein [Anaerolineales bacterium]